MTSFHLPGPDDRSVIMGSTGSGKTVFAVLLLSTRDYKVRPWYILDFKRDPTLAQLPAQEIPLSTNPPKSPGLYVLRPRPSKTLQDELEAFFWALYEQEDCGLYTDEGTMISAHNHGFRGLLTQGRSKRIEMVTLSQRPVKLLGEVFSEATFFAVFNLTKYSDRKIVSDWLPDDLYTANTRLIQYHCIWYDVAEGWGTELLPAPAPDVILARFNPPTGQDEDLIQGPNHQGKPAKLVRFL